eukprot:379476_1
MIACFVLFLFGLSNSQSNDTIVIFYPGTEVWHLTGSKYNTTAWYATVKDKSEQYLTYGPYTNKSNKDNEFCGPNHDLITTFTLQIDNNYADNITVISLDIHDAQNNKILKTTNVYRYDFGYSNSPQDFNVSFTNPNCSTSLEFRVFYHCCSEIIHFKTTLYLNIIDLNSKMHQFWLNSHHYNFQLITNQSIRFGTNDNGYSYAQANEGSFIRIHPSTGIWYLFHRETNYISVPSYCSKIGFNAIFRILVRYSTDNGNIWSSPTIVAQPVADTYSECAIVDGGAYYDQEINTWYYLSQCLARSGGWTLCLYYTKNDIPWNVTWIAKQQNPVVKGGELFSQICNLKGSHCGPHTVDEGTPEIVNKLYGFYYVTFHGYDYNANIAVRGIAKTRDFMIWYMFGYDIPGDVIYSPLDCNGENGKNVWNNIKFNTSTGCVGGGAGTILYDGNYYYHIIETMDEALTCDTSLGAQNWVEAILRLPTFDGVSGTWEQLHDGSNVVANEPIVVPWKVYGCGLQYQRLFKNDIDGSVYFSIWINDFSNGYNEMHVYQLVDVVTNNVTLPIVVQPLFN